MRWLADVHHTHTHDDITTTKAAGRRFVISTAGQGGRLQFASSFQVHRFITGLLGPRPTGVKDSRCLIGVATFVNDSTKMGYGYLLV